MTLLGLDESLERVLAVHLEILMILILSLLLVVPSFASAGGKGDLTEEIRAHCLSILDELQNYNEEELAHLLKSLKEGQKSYSHSLQDEETFTKPIVEFASSAHMHSLKAETAGGGMLANINMFRKKEITQLEYEKLKAIKPIPAPRWRDKGGPGFRFTKSTDGKSYELVYTYLNFDFPSNSRIFSITPSAANLPVFADVWQINESTWVAKVTEFVVVSENELEQKPVYLFFARAPAATLTPPPL